LIHSIVQDIRYGIRVLIKNPGFTLAALITLALGIGVNTAIFSVVYGVLLRPLPYKDGGRLVVLHQQSGKDHAANVAFSPKEIFDYRDKNHTLVDVVENHTMFFLLLGKDTAERVQTCVVSANFFDALGVKPLLGRTFVPGDETPNSDAVLVLSYQYWQSRHGGDPTIVGRVFQMNNRPHTVIGVLPPIPEYPAAADVYMPTSQCPFRSNPRTIANRKARFMNVFGRLKPGVSLEQAKADLGTLAGQLEASYPDAYPKNYGYTATATSLQGELTTRARTTFLVLLGAAGFVLMIACANVANLLLARLLKVERELAIRTALGAGRWRLVRQLLTESMLLSLGGGLLGLALTPATVTLLAKFAERFTTRATEVRIDGAVLLFALLISMLTGLLFGLAPAFTTGRHTAESLKQGSGRTTTSRGRRMLRGALVVSQVAVSFMLLIGAGLMIRSFSKLLQVNPGFSPDHLLTMRLSPNFSHYQQQQQFTNLWRNILRRAHDVPGVQSVSMGTSFPFSPGALATGPGAASFEIEGRRISKGELAPLVDQTVVSSEYFQTIRQPLVKGRLFTDHDDANSLLVAVINQAMAKHRWPSEDAVGKRVTFDAGQHWVTVIGIVGDAKEYGLEHPVVDEIYLPVEQNGFAQSLILRTQGDPMALASAVRGILHDIDPQLAVDQVNTVERLQHESLTSPRVITILLGVFAALALVISACGIAAVMALSVRQRTQELGIRIALGAAPAAVIGMVVRQGLAMAVAGTVVGIAGAIALTRLLATLLYSTSPTDGITFAAVSMLFLAVAALACFIPARQVTEIDPLIALRRE